ncbi:hypothetical protein [Rhizobium sp.]
MKIVRTLLALATLFFVAGCTIESDIILPDPTAAGAAITGFPSDRPFRIETYDAEKGAYKPFATLTPERETDAVRYTVKLDDGTPNRLVVQARKMSDNNYLIRFAQTIEGLRPSLNESGIAFLTVRDGTYYLMSSISDDGWIEEIFAGDALPRGAGTSSIKLDTMDQAARISAWFGANYTRLADRRDYVRFRVAP